MNSLYSTPQVALTGAVDPSTITNERQTELASFWRMLVRRRATVLKIFVGFVVLVVIGTLLWPKQYTSTIKVIAGNQNGPGSPSDQSTDLPVLNAMLIASGTQTSETYAELFQETPVAEKVIQELHLNTGPASLLMHVNVQPVTNTNILTVSVTWGNREQSAAIANAFGQAIVDRQRDLVSSQANAAITSLKQQLPQAQTRMNAAQNKLASFEAQHRIANIDQQTQNTISSMAALDAKIGQVQADERQQTAQLSSAQTQLAGIAPTITGNTTVSENPVVAQMQQQLTQVEVQLQQAEQQCTDQHPTVIALKQQKDQLQ
ncbi:MAG: hypothetical protein JO092_04975, partial [Candidatus Eremiobacteraeota bacterium]|nr:hypothetical protein [Candidatus Eremiobacteraeota bacterium]